MGAGPGAGGVVAAAGRLRSSPSPPVEPGLAPAALPPEHGCDGGLGWGPPGMEPPVAWSQGSGGHGHGQSSALGVRAVAAVWGAQPWEGARGGHSLPGPPLPGVTGGVRRGWRGMSLGPSCWRGAGGVGWGLPHSSHPAQALPAGLAPAALSMAARWATLGVTRVPPAKQHPPLPRSWCRQDRRVRGAPAPGTLLTAVLPLRSAASRTSPAGSPCAGCTRRR